MVINTLNEEKNIADCIKSVACFSPEIIIVDMYSEDKTIKIAKNLGAKVFLFKKMGYVEPARNFAISKANGEWILILDADERLNIKSPDDFWNLLNNANGITSYIIPCKNKILGRWMQGSGWGMEIDKHIRLFKRGTVKWIDTIHSVPIVEGISSIIPPDCMIHIDHNHLSSIHDFINKLNRYTDQEVKKLESENVKFDLNKLYYTGISEFDYRYEPHQDGSHSFILATMMSFYKITTWVKLWEKEGYPDFSLPKDISEVLEKLDEMIKKQLLQQKNIACMKKSSNSVYSENGCLLYGFYEKEGHHRWVSPNAVIEIPQKIVQKLSKISFDIMCAESSKYETFPFSVNILLNDNRMNEIFFSNSFQKENVNFKLLNDQKNIITINTMDSNVLNTKDDIRLISTIFLNFKIDTKN